MPNNVQVRVGFGFALKSSDSLAPILDNSGTIQA